MVAHSKVKLCTHICVQGCKYCIVNIIFITKDSLVKEQTLGSNSNILFWQLLEQAVNSNSGS